MQSLIWMLSAAVIFALSACTSKNEQLEYGLDVKETLRVNLQVEPPTLDWLLSTDTTSYKVQVNIMEGLVDFDLADPEMKMIPCLASEWKTSDKGRVWTFTLRSDVKWTDGVAFTGQQVIDAWERLLNPATASQYAYFLFSIKNARAYNSGKLKSFRDVGVHLDEKGQLIVELEKPLAYFPMLLAHSSTYPIRKELIAKFGAKWTDPENIQTLGPYKLKIWDHDKAIVLERFDGYFGEKAKIKYMIGYMINEFSTALNLMGRGRMDFQEELPAIELPQLRQKPGFRQVSELLIYYYGFNVRKPPFNNIKVRQAFVAGLDRKQITQLLAGGHAPLTGFIPIGLFGYQSDRGQEFDPQLAARLLDEAGYKDRSRFPRVTLAFNTNENHQRIAENVQAQLKKNLGLDIELANEEWKVYLNNLRAKPAEMFREGWLADYPDPSTFIDLMLSGSENNHTGWSNKAYDQIALEASRTDNRARRLELYTKAQQILTEEQFPVLPIYSGVRHVMISERTKNFPVTPLSRYPIKKVSFQ